MWKFLMLLAAVMILQNIVKCVCTVRIEPGWHGCTRDGRHNRCADNSLTLMVCLNVHFSDGNKTSSFFPDIGNDLFKSLCYNHIHLLLSQGTERFCNCSDSLHVKLHLVSSFIMVKPNMSCGHYISSYFGRVHTSLLAICGWFCNHIWLKRYFRPQKSQ